MDNGPQVLGPLGYDNGDISAECVEVDGDVVFSIRQPNGVTKITLNQKQLGDLYSVTARAMHWSRIRREERWRHKRLEQKATQPDAPHENQLHPRIISIG